MHCGVDGYDGLSAARCEAKDNVPNGFVVVWAGLGCLGGALRVIGQCDGRVEDATAVRSPRLGERPACPPPERWRST